MVWCALTALLADRLAAADILSLIPADVPGVIVFRHPDIGIKRINEWLAQVDSDIPTLDLESIQAGLGLPRNAWDGSQPIALILTRPEIRRSPLILAFSPKRPENFPTRLKPAEDEAGAGEQRAPEQEGIANGQPTSPEYVWNHDGVVFVTNKWKAMRAVRKVSPEGSLAERLDAHEKSLYEGSDVFVRLPMDQWRDDVQRLLQLLSAVSRFGLNAKPRGEIETQTVGAVFDWFFDAAGSAIRQMESLTLSLTINDDGLKLDHYHRFLPGRSVAEYLAAVKRTGTDLWAGLPNRPFIVLFASDWSAPAQNSLCVNMARRVFEDKALVAKLPEEHREQIIQQTMACYGQMHGLSLMATTPRTAARPIQVLGRYTFEDAGQGLKQLRTIEAHSSEFLSVFTPAGSCYGKLVSCEREGLAIDQMKLNVAGMSPELQKQVTAVYGSECLFQQALADDNHVVYAVANDADLIRELVKVTRSGSNIGADPQIRGVMEHLPPHPNCVLMLDIGRIFAVGQQLRRNFPTTAPAVPGGADAADEPDESSGPTVGWAGTVHPGAFSGRVYVSREDAVRAVKLAHQIDRGSQRSARRRPRPPRTTTQPLVLPRP